MVRRIRAILFLATPHRGADIAVTLSRILSLASPRHPPSVIKDIIPHSAVVQSINDEFRRLCDSAETLQLFSFYETQPLNYGLGKGIIVEKHCAVMHYPWERMTYLDADHREVARYASPEDPSYITVRNALAAVIDEHRRTRTQIGDDMGQERREALLKFLGSPEIPDDDIGWQDSRRLHGSGQWFLQKDSFEKWRDASSSNMLWLRGRPGSGKSFLAGQVVNYLRQQGRDCCTFFFKAGNSNTRTINSFLRSIAYQMANIHEEIHSTIIELSKNIMVDEMNHNQLWHQLYASGGILKVKLDREQYWVIDALEECRDSTEIMNFLFEAQEKWPLRILITSREPFWSSMTHRTEVLTETISQEDSNRDIALFLRINLDYLPALTPEAREQMAEEIEQRSKGRFLWAKLMLEELRHVHTAAEAKMVLASNPSEMGGHDSTARKAAAGNDNARVEAMLLDQRADYADSDQSSDSSSDVSSLGSGSNSEGSSATSGFPSENLGISMQRLADVIFHEAGLATTLTAAMSHPSLQSDQVLEEFKRLMGYYYKDLKKSSTIPGHDQVARLFKKSSGTITNEARRLLGLVHTAPRFPDLGAKMTRKEQDEMMRNLLRRTFECIDEGPPTTKGLTGQHQETSIHDDATGWEDDNEEDEGLEGDVYPEISAAVAFLKDGIPMQKFQANLRKFVLDAVSECDVMQSPKCLPRSLPNMVDEVWGRLRLNLPERCVPRRKRRIRWTCVSRTYFRLPAVNELGLTSL